jgi:hypothetical protein
MRQSLRQATPSLGSKSMKFRLNRSDQGRKAVNIALEPDDVVQ